MKNILAFIIKIKELYIFKKERKKRRKRKREREREREILKSFGLKIINLNKYKIKLIFSAVTLSKYNLYATSEINRSLIFSVCRKYSGNRKLLHNAGKA